MTIAMSFAGTRTDLTTREATALTSALGDAARVLHRTDGARYAVAIGECVAGLGPGEVRIEAADASFFLWILEAMDTANFAAGMYDLMKRLRVHIATEGRVSA
ncbi:MAG: hypothetical protein ACXVZ1_10465 [Gaiellaceae bacterium]